MKNKLFKILIVFAVLLLLIPLFASCGKSDSEGDATAKEKEKTEIKLQVNETPETVLLKQEKVTISGKVENAEQLTISGNEVIINDDGSFSYEAILTEGTNKIEIVASNSKEKLKDVTSEIVITRANPVIDLKIPGNTTVSESSYKLEGSTLAGATVTLYQDTTVIESKTADANGYFAFTVNTENEGTYHYKVSASKEDYAEHSLTMDVTRQLSAEEKAAAKRASATTIEFAQLKKNPDKYEGEYVKYKGEIVQILEEGNFTVIRLAVTPTSYGYDFNDIIWVEYIGTTEFVDEDIVTVYGTITGEYSYTSTAGWEITLPAMLADSIE